MRSLIITCAVIFSLAGIARSQEVTEKINKCISEGDAASLSVHFNTSLDISLPDTDQTMSSAHATQVIKNFFKENPPKSYKVNHVGSSREATKYIIGTYISGNKSFKVYALLKQNKGTYLIVQLQFEKE
jgi:hypothetical protein